MIFEALRILGSDAKVMGAVYSILKAYRDPGTADADESGPTPGLDTSGSTAITESSALISRAGSYTGDTETKLNKGKQRALTPAVSSGLFICCPRHAMVRLTCYLQIRASELTK